MVFQNISKKFLPIAAVGAILLAFGILFFYAKRAERTPTTQSSPTGLSKEQILESLLPSPEARFQLSNETMKKVLESLSPQNQKGQMPDEEKQAVLDSLNPSQESSK